MTLPSFGVPQLIFVGIFSLEKNTLHRKSSIQKETNSIQKGKRTVFPKM